jgi:hypothetical protein
VQFPEVSCSVSDGHYTELGNFSISDEEKGRRALGTRVSHLIRRRHVCFACVLHMEKGRCALTRRVSHMGKREMHDNNARLPFTFSTPCFMILSAIAPADRIMKHGVVVKEARSIVRSIRTNVGLKAGDHEL